MTLNLLIMGLDDALRHVPQNKTYVISILPGTQRFYDEFFNAVDKPLYIRHQYRFDDITPRVGDGLLFNEDIATAIIQDFQRGRKDCLDLLVHCRQGISRSPAVAIALNDVFNLGHDTEALKEKYSEANWHVYDVLKKTGEKLLR